jgi:purine-cytosine permease-like protein
MSPADRNPFDDVVDIQVIEIPGATMTTISTDSDDLNVTSGESHIPVGEGRDSVGRIETRGVDYIPHVERNSSPRTVFWAFEGPQFSLGTYIFGGAMVAAGLSWWACVAATVLGVGIGSATVSLVGMIGPRTGTNSTVSSGAFFGVRGRYLGSMLAQLGNLGFNVFTLWPAALATMVAMHRLVGTGQSTLALCIWMAVIGALCCLVSVLGHATLVVAYKWTAIVSCVVLVVFVVMEAHNFKTSFAGSVYQYGTFWPTWLFALSVAIVNPISYGVSVNDYTRRLPADTPRATVFTSLFASIFSGNVLAYLFGAFTVLCYDSYSADFPTAWAGISPMWFLVPIVIIAVVGNAIGGGINIYNASLDLHTVLWRVSRFSNAIIVTVVSLVITYLATVVWNFTNFLSTFTDIISAGLAPWLAIMIIGHIRAHGHYRVLDLHSYTTPDDRGIYWFQRGFEPRALASWVVGAVVAVLFSSSAELVGPISRHLDSIDLSFLSGLIVGGATYLVLDRRPDRASGAAPAPRRSRATAGSHEPVHAGLEATA